MAVTALIPILDHDSECSLYYLVEYKLSGDASYTSLGNMLPSEYTEGSPPITVWKLQIDNLVNDASYDVRVTRYCCNQAFSSPTILTFTATP